MVNYLIYYLSIVSSTADRYWKVISILFVLHGDVVLTGQLAPDSVWVIDVYLTTAESALLHHVRHQHQKSADLYHSLRPNPELSSTILTASWATASQLDKSRKVQQKRKKEMAISQLKDEDLSGHQEKPEAVTITYGTSAVIYTMTKEGVSPLKRAKVQGRRSLLIDSTDESAASDLTGSGNDPPPLPPRLQKPPPLPPRIKQEEPPPVPQHREGPRPPPRGASTRNSTGQIDIPPPPPPKITLSDTVPSAAARHTSFIYQDDLSDEDVNEVLNKEDSLCSSLDHPPAISKVPSEDSDISDRFATPPLTSPRSEERDMTDTSLPLSHSQSYRTPLGESFADDNHTLSKSTKTANLNLKDVPIETDKDIPCSPTSPLDVYHDSFDTTPHDHHVESLLMGRDGATASEPTDGKRGTGSSADFSMVPTTGMSENPIGSGLFNVSTAVEEEHVKNEQDIEGSTVEQQQEDGLTQQHTPDKEGQDTTSAPPDEDHPRDTPQTGHQQPHPSPTAPPTDDNDTPNDNIQAPSTITDAPAPPTQDEANEVSDGTITDVDEVDGDKTVHYTKEVAVDKPLAKASSEVDLRELSPVPPDLSESTSDEEGFYASMQVRKNFTARPRAETFIGLKGHPTVSTDSAKVSFISVY